MELGVVPDDVPKTIDAVTEWMMEQVKEKKKMNIGIYDNYLSSEILHKKLTGNCRTELKNVRERGCWVYGNNSRFKWFRGRVTPVVLNLMECMSGRMW
jgi:hypothetical protein